MYLLILCPYNAPLPFPLFTSLFCIFVSLLLFFLIFARSIVFLESTYKWYHTVFVFPCLTYFSNHILQVCPFCCKWQNSSLFKDWIVFHRGVCVCVCVHHIILIHSSVDEYLHCFYILAIINSATVNIGVHIPFWISVFMDMYPEVELLGHIVVVLFLRTLLTVFHSDCTSLHSYQQWMRISFFPHDCQYLLFMSFLMIAIMTGMRWYLITLEICVLNSMIWFWECFVNVPLRFP